jgi:hypothetical protein
MMMASINWLKERRFRSLERRDCDWVLIFDGNATLVISCLWRLLEEGRIRRTSLDHGQRFGLPAPVDAAAEMNNRLQGALLESVDLDTGTLDIELGLSTGHVFQVLPDSSGYESWTATNETTQFVATGGGRLDVLPARHG